MSILASVSAGTAVSCGAVTVMAYLDPGPAVFPHLQASRPLASYMALAGAAFGNGLELFALVAAVQVSCLLVWGWSRARKTRKAAQPAARPLRPAPAAARSRA